MGQVTILDTTTKNPISLIGERGGICWGGDTTDAEKNYKRGMDCILSNHGRTLEYPRVDMILDGYSAKVIREWYTHVGGAPTRLQASTRYIDYTKGEGFSYVIPRTIEGNPEAKERFVQTMKQINESIIMLEKDCGIPREDASMCLPIAMTTKIVDSRNLRNLIDMAHQRKCTRAYWEFRELFHDIETELAKLSDEWAWIAEHLLVPKCELFGYCTEKKSCGRKPKALS